MQISTVKQSISNAMFANTSMYRQLDVWRALAAIWVLMEHACSTVITSESIVGDPATFLSKSYIAFSLSGQLGVAMFFVISGYCISLAADNALKRKKSFFDFFTARLRRIYPPYYASLALAVILPIGFVVLAKLGIIAMPNHQADFLHSSFIYYFANLTLTQEIFKVQPIQAIYWSLSFEVAFYLIVTTLILLNTKFKYSLYAMLFITTLISLLWLIISPDTCPFPLNLWYLFGLGAIVYIGIQHPYNLQIKIFGGITGILVIAYAYFQPGHYTLGHPSSRTQALFGLTFSCILVLMYSFDEVLMKNRLVRIAAFLGTMSYSIYLSHAVIIAIPRQLMIKMGFVGDKYWITFLVQIIIGIGFGYIFHILFERPFISSNAKAREAKASI